MKICSDFLPDRLRRRLFIVVFSLLAGLLPRATWADAPPKPALTVILERNELLAGQAMKVGVWLENATEAKVTDIRLSLFSAPFLKIGVVSPGAGCTVQDVIKIDDLEPGATKVRDELCLQADSSVEERDETIGFRVDFILLQKNNKSSGSLVAEKKISIGLLGTETIGGVSLRLASYFIPGVLFLAIVRLFRLPMELGAVESAAVSVAVSVVMFVLVGFVLPSQQLRFAGIGSSISTVAFAAMCIASALFALIVVAAYHGISRKNASAEKARTVQDGDDESTIIQKALLRANGCFKATKVTAGGKEFFGSLAIPKSGGGRVLIGWYKFNVKDPERRAKFDEWFKNDEFLEAMNWAIRWKVQPRMEDPIKTDDQGILQTTVSLVMHFDEKSEQTAAGRAELDALKPLVLS